MLGNNKTAIGVFFSLVIILMVPGSVFSQSPGVAMTKDFVEVTQVTRSGESLGNHSLRIAGINKEGGSDSVTIESSGENLPQVLSVIESCERKATLAMSNLKKYNFAITYNSKGTTESNIGKYDSTSERTLLNCVLYKPGS